MVNLFDRKILDDDFKERGFVFCVVLCCDLRWCDEKLFRDMIDG